MKVLEINKALANIDRLYARIKKTRRKIYELEEKLLVSLEP